MQVSNSVSPKANFTRNVLTLMTGTTFAQAIPIAIAPILTRIYTPEDFGVLAIYMSICAFASMVAGGRFELAIMNQPNEQDANNILALSASLVSIVSLFLFFIVAIFNFEITNLIGNQSISFWLYLIPVTVLFTGYGNCFNYWLNRKAQYGAMSIGKIAQSSTNGLTSISVGYFPLNGMILGAIIGPITSVIYYGRRVLSKNFTWNLNRNNYFGYIAKNKDYVIYSLPNAIVNGLRLVAINVLIGNIFGPAILGYYAFAWKMLQAPIDLVSGAVGQVFFRELIELKEKKRILIGFVSRFIVKQTMLSILPFSLMYFFAEHIFELIFGPEWGQAGRIVKILCPWLLLAFVTSPLSYVFIVLDCQAGLLALGVVYAVVPISILLLSNDVEFFLVLYRLSYSMSVVLVVMVLSAIYIVKKHEYPNERTA